MKYVTADQMRELDRKAIEAGIPASRLMENAGRAVAEEAMKIVKQGTVFVFSGYGNNGGDGFVAARYLIKNKYDVKVFLVGKVRPFSPEAEANLKLLLDLNCPPQAISKTGQIDKYLAHIKKPGIIIDAIFGTGIRQGLEDFYVKLISAINSAGSTVISVDVPSGLDSDTGRPSPAAVRANLTVTLGLPKVGFKSAEAIPYTGKLIVADIGLPPNMNGKTLHLRTGRAGVLKPGHPWIYKNQFLKPAKTVHPGEIVTVLNAENKFIGRGYFNPRSEISIRLFTFKDEPIDKNFLLDRIRRALEKRAPILGKTNAYRAVFSESDSLPGLVIDRYADTVVFQILTFGMEEFKELIVECVKEVLNPKFIYEKSESPFRKIEGLKDIHKWHGEKGRREIEIFEGRAKYLVDIERSHKTGFYLDQRRSRLAMDNISKGKTVLDLFCYTGGFAVAAAVYGAKSVRGIDVKKEWLDLAVKNCALNNVTDKVKFEAGDAFAALEKINKKAEQFDIIILDPPSFLRSRRDIAAASKGYEEINYLAMKALAPGGMLATFSCSYSMPNERFSQILKKAAARANKTFRVLKRCRQAEDHPIIREIPETEYLKGYFLEVNR